MKESYHYTVDDLFEDINKDIDDAWDEFLEQASCHFNPVLMDGPDECDECPF